MSGGTAVTRPNAPLATSGWQTVGPFFPRPLFGAADSDLRRRTAEAAPTTRGTPIILRGQMVELGGGAVVNGVIEAWQADAAGRFRHPSDPSARDSDPDFAFWGRAWSDAEGRYEFRSVLPGGYRDAAGSRAPHINLSIIASGVMRRLVTTVFFPGFAAENEADPVLNALPEASLRARLVATEEGEEDGFRVFRFDLVLRGAPEEETPFFLD